MGGHGRALPAAQAPRPHFTAAAPLQQLVTAIGACCSHGWAPLAASSEPLPPRPPATQTLRQGALPLSASQLPAGGAAASPSSSPACSAAAAGVEPAASAEDSSEREVEGEGSAYLLGGLSELKAQLDAAAAEAGGCGTGRINEGCEEACGDEEEEEEQEGEMEEIEEEIEGDLEGDLVEDFEEDEELEAEVEAMLEATSAAAAAAERLTGESDQRYLSKILGARARPAALAAFDLIV